MNTTQIWLTVLIAVAAYFIGGLSPAVLISRLVSGKDIRETGSGNAGATNVMRSLGVQYGILTFVLDVLKGVIPTLIAKFCIDQYAHYSAPNASYAAYLVGFMVILGHTFPLLLGFRGGKGVATSLGDAICNPARSYYCTASGCTEPYVRDRPRVAWVSCEYGSYSN